MRVVLIAAMLLVAGTLLAPTAVAPCRPDVAIYFDNWGNLHVDPGCEGIVSDTIETVRDLTDPR